MVLYYIRIAWRNMSTQLPFYALNIGGLAVGFALRVDFPWTAFLLPLILVALTTLLTVWVQSMQILRINPATTLKE